ncbi:ABC transporter permease [Chitinivibrio alkaliphilus]|uniref:Transport permease protein n=1 Tax=Chitinivibrio alkaliphilus ACht1 TaxID=1313304 RepID=U7D685_9BACT|nr:ABC transporter permease [Chitinivibrio alkaliphilus]ERP31086.1 ABC-type transport system, permease component [Chitinivibrio alkaliphilus ACht1]
MIPLYFLIQHEVLRFSKVAVQTVFAPLISTTLYFIIFDYSFQGREVPAYDIPYITFIIPGLLLMSLLQNAFANSSSSLIIAKYQGNIVDFILAPLSHWDLTIGFMVGGIIRGLLVGSVIYLVSIFFYGGAVAYPFLALTTALLVSGVFSTLGILAGLWAEKFDHVSIFSNFVITPLTFLSGIFYSVQSLPPLYAQLSRVNPIYYMIDLMRYSFLGMSDVSPLLSLCITGGTLMVLFFLTALLFKRGYKIKN